MPGKRLTRGRLTLALLAMLGTVTTAGCSAAAMQAWGEALQTAAGGSNAAGGMGLAGNTKLMIFGGRGHDVYLGCINCSEYASDSVFNQYGTYGSKYSGNSILNSYSDYGSKYSNYGACNPYANDPPVIVDGAGEFYGRLTLNRYHAQRSNNQQLLTWLAGVCA